MIACSSPRGTFRSIPFRIGLPSTSAVSPRISSTLLLPLSVCLLSRRALRLRARLGRAAGALPGRKPAANMGDVREPHVLRGLGRQRGAPAAGAEEHEALGLG